MVAGFQMVQARQHAQQGLDQLESAQHDLGPAQLIRGEGLDRMKAAQAEFDQAASAGDSFFLKPFSVVPFLGRQVRSVDSLTSSAAKVVDVGVDAMEASTTPAQAADGRRAGPGRARATSSARSRPRRAAELQGLDLGPSQALVGPLADARTKFARQLGKVRTLDGRTSTTRPKGIGQMAQGPDASTSSWRPTTPRCAPAPGCC